MSRQPGPRGKSPSTGRRRPSAERQVLARMEENAEAIARAMVARSQSEVPEYAAHADEAFLASALQHCRDHVAAFLVVAREGRMLDGVELDFVRGQATLRARQGVPLEPLLHVYRMGHVAVHEAIVDAAGTSPEGLAAAIALTRRTLSHSDLITTTYTRSYLEAQHALELEAETSQRDLVDRALVGALHPGTRDADQARALGFDPDEPYVAVVVVRTEEAEPAADELAAVLASLRRLGGAAGRPMLGAVREGEALVLVSVPRGSAAEAAEVVGQALVGHPTLRAGIGLPCTGLADMRRGYTQARSMAYRVRGGAVRCLADLSPFDYLLSTADETARALVDPRIVAMLQRDAKRAGPLVRTLLAYVDADLSAAVAAERLYVHPNTVHYRLSRIAAACGRDPRRIRDLFELVTAIRLLGLLPDG